MKFQINSKIKVLIFTALVVMACGNNDSEKGSAQETTPKEDQKVGNGAKQISFTKDQYNLAGIETGQVEMRNLSNIVKLNGVVDVEPKSMASVSAPLGGYLKTAGRLPGEEIKKGQVLATIENPEFIQIQQDYLESLGKLEFLEEEFNRQKQLREEDVNSAKTFQEVSSEYKITQGKVKALEQLLTLVGINSASVKNGTIIPAANLYAPITGYVKTSNVNIGDYVTPQDVLFEIVNLDDIHLALNAFEKDLEKIEVGQSVKFSLSNDNSFDRTASVFLKGKATGEDRITPVHCHIEKGDEKNLLPGMYVKAWVETGTNKQLAIPSEAIVQYEGKDYVIFQTTGSDSGYSFKLEQIKKGIEQEGYTGITFAESANVKDLKPVTRNAYTILSALRNYEEEE